MDKEFKLRVVGIEKKWVNKGRISIHLETMQKMGLKTGDIVKITGKKSTSAIVLPTAKINENLIQMDEITRKNSGTEIGDAVRIEKIEVEPAKKVILAPIEKEVRILCGSNALNNYLLNHTIKKDDIVSIKAAARVKNKTSSFSYDELFLIVANTIPSNIVQITKTTEFEIVTK
ncbi:MAG: hypothetical protein HWN66_17415 [Candidatus Helarchaeota archaeon]|nr:hypothetical protein [Candidatus Helarchaeota archaeon]